MPVVVTNVHPKPREREFSPFISAEHINCYLVEFIKTCYRNQVVIRDVIWVGDMLQIYVDEKRQDWATACDVDLYDANGGLLQPSWFTR